jgi:hypothetical protein
MGEAGDQTGIDRVGLGELADRGGKGSQLPRVNSHHGQAGLPERCQHRDFVTSRRLHDDQGERLLLDFGQQPFDTVGGVLQRDDVGPVRAALLVAGQVEFLGSDVHAPKQTIGLRIGRVRIFHGGRPFLANAGLDAQATVRVNHQRDRGSSFETVSKASRRHVRPSKL